MTVTRRGVAPLLALPLTLALALLAACDSPRPDSAAPPPAPTGTPGQTVTVTVDERPFQLHVPTSYRPGTKAPLVVLLHGYTSSGAEQESYFRLTPESDKRGFLYAIPDGTTNRNGQRFWNATAACCDFDRTGVDDSGYLTTLIETVAASYAVDTARVYLVGHSNGGFMAYRMACEHADRIAAIVSLAGAMPPENAQCKPTRPVSVLQIHGTADDTVRYDGGGNAAGGYKSVPQAIADWRGMDGCEDKADRSAPALDLDSGLGGAETTVTAYGGCRDGTRVALWSIKDGAHVPALSEHFAPAVVDFLYAQTRP
jgi:polyhydroxybutyrate depolymerase